MRKLIILIIFTLPSLSQGKALFKCTVNGTAKYQSGPCMDNGEAVPLDLNEPSPELKEKIYQQALEKEWEKQEAIRQKSEAERAERDRRLDEQIKQEQLNHYRNLERDRQEAKQRELEQIEKAEREKFEWRCEHHELRRDHFSACADYLQNKRWRIPWETHTGN